MEDREKSLSLQRDYQVTTGNLKKAVKRNIKRFPPDFMFQLTKEEFEKLTTDLIFQNGISRWGGTRKMPYAFTEQGLAMLSGLLNSDTAINVNISRAARGQVNDIKVCNGMHSYNKRIVNILKNKRKRPHDS